MIVREDRVIDSADVFAYVWDYIRVVPVIGILVTVHFTFRNVVNVVLSDVKCVLRVHLISGRL
jgi:hypothetical protein